MNARIFNYYWIFQSGNWRIFFITQGYLLSNIWKGAGVCQIIRTGKLCWVEFFANMMTQYKHMYICNSSTLDTWCPVIVAFSALATGVHYILCSFEDVKMYIFRTLGYLGFTSGSVSAYTMAAQTPALSEFRKITTFQGKTQYLLNTLHLIWADRIRRLNVLLMKKILHFKME